jgi:cob(I)alamin adenosyltransferase
LLLYYLSQRRFLFIRLQPLLKADLLPLTLTSRWRLRAQANNPHTICCLILVVPHLFSIAGSVANPRALEKDSPDITDEMVARLTEEVHRIEATEGILSDWSLPGDHAGAAAFDVARTVCRRAERAVVHLTETGEPVDARAVVYLNRLSDLLWLIGRLLELRAGIDARLRDSAHTGPRWSRAW